MAGHWCWVSLVRSQIIMGNSLNISLDSESERHLSSICLVCLDGLVELKSACGKYPSKASLYL
jgi:hypothetical protein